jgi:hypothetical protein
MHPIACGMHSCGDGNLHWVPSLSSIGNFLPFDHLAVLVVLVYHLLLLAPSACLVQAVRGLARFASRKGRCRSRCVRRRRGLPSARSGCFSEEACRATTEYAVCVANRSFAPRRCACTAGCSRCGCAFDIVVKAFDDIAGAGLFKVRRLVF